MKRILAVAGLGLISMLNIASAEPRRGNDCDRGTTLRSSRTDRWQPGYNRVRDRYDRRDAPARYDYRDGYGYRESRDRYDRRDDDRSTAASAGIVAGSAAGGAAIGGLAGGGKGAIIGAIAGGAAGLVYDQATRDNDDGRNRRRRR